MDTKQGFSLASAIGHSPKIVPDVREFAVQFGQFVRDDFRLSVKALAGPCRTEPTIVTEVGLRRMTIFGTGFYNLIKSEVNIDEL